MAKDIKIKVTYSGYIKLPTLENGYLNDLAEYNPAACIREDIDRRFQEDEFVIEQAQEGIDGFLWENKLDFKFDINDILDEYCKYAVKLLTENSNPYVNVSDSEDYMDSIGYDYYIDYEIPVKDFCEMLKNSENRDNYKGLIKALDNLIKNEKSKGQEKD